MADSIDSNLRKFFAGGAIAKHLRVKTPTALATAGATDIELGTLETATTTSADEASVRLRTAKGTAKMIASGAVSVNAAVYGAAGGKVSATTNANPIGIALSQATGDGDVIEVMRGTVPAQSLFGAGEDHTAGDTLTTAESGSMHTNVGAGGAIELELPAATVGLEFYFYVIDSENLQIQPASGESIALPSDGVQGTADKYLVASSAGEWLHLFCQTAGEWEAVAWGGTWTAEAP